MPHHCDDEPLCVDDHLHQPQPQRPQTQNPSPGPTITPGKDVQLHSLHQEAGKAAAEQHPEEKPPRGTGGEILPHNEGKGETEEAGCEDQEEGVESHRALVFLVFQEGHAGQQRDEEHEGEGDAGCSEGLQHDAPRCTQVTQVVVQRVQGGATTLRAGSHVGSHCDQERPELSLDTLL